MSEDRIYELEQELEIRTNDNADLYARLCNALMQLDEANTIIKEYSHDDFYTKGGGRYENPNPFFARKYLKKWGVK